MKKILMFFAAGCFGALVNSLLVWKCGELGVTHSFGVAIAPELTASWLYPRIVWGGIWGELFLLPVYNSKPMYKGALLSLGPTFVQLLIIFPYQADKGLGGMDLGLLTPAFVLVFNLLWGVVTSLTIKYSR